MSNVLSVDIHKMEGCFFIFIFSFSTNISNTLDRSLARTHTHTHAHNTNACLLVQPLFISKKKLIGHIWLFSVIRQVELLVIYIRLMFCVVDPAFPVLL